MDSIVKHGTLAAHLQIIDIILAHIFSVSELGSVFGSSVINILGLFLSEGLNNEWWIKA